MPRSEGGGQAVDSSGKSQTIKPDEVSKIPERTEVKFISKGIVPQHLIQFLDFKGTKSKKDHTHSVVHYQVGNETVLYLKKPKVLELTSPDNSHEHYCTSCISNFLFIDVRKNCGRELMAEFAEKYYLPSNLKGLELNFLDSNDDLMIKFLSN